MAHRADGAQSETFSIESIQHLHEIARLLDAVREEVAGRAAVTA
jgi:hypothetical protein